MDAVHLACTPAQLAYSLALHVRDPQATFAAFGAVSIQVVLCGSEQRSLKRSLVCVQKGLCVSMYMYTHFDVLVVHFSDLHQDLRDIAEACCRAAFTLHRVGIVHRDLRKENLVCVSVSAIAKQWMVIDLELAAKADQCVTETKRLSAWDRDTLEVRAGKQIYTCMSDMYLIGKLLLDLGGSDIPQQAKEFALKLKSKRLTAERALQQPWILDPFLSAGSSSLGNT